MLVAHWADTCERGMRCERESIRQSFIFWNCQAWRFNSFHSGRLCQYKKRFIPGVYFSFFFFYWSEFTAKSTYLPCRATVSQVLDGDHPCLQQPPSKFFAHKLQWNQCTVMWCGIMLDSVKLHYTYTHTHTHIHTVHTAYCILQPRTYIIHNVAHFT